MDSNSNLEKSSVSSLLKITSYLRPYRLMIGGVVISLLITSTTVLMISKALQFFIDKGIAANNAAMLDHGLLVLVSIILVLAAFTFLRFYFVTYIGEKVVADIRTDVYNHILTLSPGFFEETRTGEIISRITADTTLLLAIIGSSLSVAMRNTVLLLGGVVMLAATSLHLTMMIFVLIPIIILPIIYLGRKLRVLARDSQDRVAELTVLCEQSISAIKTIQSYTRQSFESSRFAEKIKHQLQTAFKRIIWRGVLSATIISLAFWGIAFVLWIGGHQVLSGILSPGELSAFIYISVICAGATGALSEVAGDLQKAAGATERLFSFLNVQPEVIESPTPVTLPSDGKGRIEFNDVVFYYNTNRKRPVLDRVNFTIEPGKITAIVGRSGVGKTTVFMLLERFYNIDSGSITIDGIDISQLKLNDLRGSLTYVSQDPVIFSTSVLDNILYGNPNASFEEVEKAAQAASCMEFIEKMPQGFNTFLGEKGLKLSGGQKQRLSIARAILHDPKILLLDEATSSLDSENEILVHRALNNLMLGRTTIVIAHRLSTVKNADKIIVLDKGKVEETGTHETLISNKTGIYAKLAKLQFSSTN
jgi:ATP-binding cassette subfamily B protein